MARTLRLEAEEEIEADGVAPVAADAGVPAGSAAIPANAPGCNANALIDATSSVTDVRVERA